MISDPLLDSQMLSINTHNAECTKQIIRHPTDISSNCAMPAGDSRLALAWEAKRVPEIDNHQGAMRRHVLS
jgi:hypothetical protein